jgi:hypothetical protein
VTMTAAQVTVRWQTVSTNSCEFTHLDPGPNRTTPLQNTKCGAVVPSCSDWRTEPNEYFYLLLTQIYWALSCLRPYWMKSRTWSASSDLESQISHHQPYLTSRSCFVLLQSWTYILCLILMIASLKHGEAKYHSLQIWSILCDEFQLLFWKLLSAHEDQEQLKKEGQITPELGGKIWSKYILHYLPSTTAVETTVSFETYHLMKPVKFWLNMFVEYDSSNGYIYKTSSHKLVKQKMKTLFYWKLPE